MVCMVYDHQLVSHLYYLICFSISVFLIHYVYLLTWKVSSCTLQAILILISYISDRFLSDLIVSYNKNTFNLQKLVLSIITK